MEPGTLAVLFALASGPLPADSTRPDPLGDSLFPPELVLQHRNDIVLSDDQRDGIRGEVEKARPRFEELQRLLARETEGLVDLLGKESVDGTAALAQLDKVQGLERDIKRAQLALMIGIKNRLTPEQQSRLRELKRKPAAGGQPEIAAKMERVKAGIERWRREGRDLSGPRETMRKLVPLVRERKLEEAEALLDLGLAVLEGPRDEEPPEKRPGAGPSSKPGISAPEAASPEAILAEIEALRVPRVAWREISWRSCLLEGLKESRESGKPLLLWVFIDRPADDARC